MGTEATMAKVLMLLSATADLRIGAAVVSRLSALGVTSVALLRDDESVGVLLDGWSFDPGRSAAAAAAVLGAEPDSRILFPMLEVGVEANTIGEKR
jgi:hypothetical protein